MTHTNRHVSSSEQGNHGTIGQRDASHTAGSRRRRYALSDKVDEVAPSGSWVLVSTTAYTIAANERQEN
jgi:hypothetical protein